MRWRAYAVPLAMLMMLAAACQAQKARDSYDELYKAGGLDRMADQWVCFDEKNIFIFAKSDTLKEFLQENNGLKSLPAGSCARLNKGFLIVRSYAKGVALSDAQDFYMKDGESWISDPFHLGKPSAGRMRSRVSFETLRYRRAVEATTNHVTSEVALTFGKCE